MLPQHKNIGKVETSPVKNPYNGEFIHYVNWMDGFPNVNFVKGKEWLTWVYNNGDPRFIHTSNESTFCYTCDGRTSLLPILKMRGLCEKSQFDKKYVLAYNAEDAMFYQGDRHINITYESVRNSWVISP